MNIQRFIPRKAGSRVRLYPLLAGQEAWKAAERLSVEDPKNAASMFLEACSVLRYLKLDPSEDKSWQRIGADPEKVKDFLRTHKREIRSTKRDAVAKKSSLQFDHSSRGLQRRMLQNGINSNNKLRF